MVWYCPGPRASEGGGLRSAGGRHMANSAAALRLQSDLKAISQSPPEGCASFP